MYYIALFARIMSVAVSIASMADPTAMRWAGLINFFLVLVTSLVFNLNDVSAMVAGLTYLSGIFIASLGFRDAYTPMPSIVEHGKAIDSPGRSRYTPTRCRTDSFSSVESSESDDSDQSSEYYCPASVGEEPDDPLLEPLTLRWRPTTMYDDDTLHFMADLSAMQKYLRTLLIKQRRRARLAAA